MEQNFRPAELALFYLFPIPNQLLVWRPKGSNQQQTLCRLQSDFRPRRFQALKLVYARASSEEARETEIEVTATPLSSWSENG
jgi:hypothetical protein